MAYNNKTYGTSPFVNSATTTARAAPPSRRQRTTAAAVPDAEALSDQIGDQVGEQTSDPTDKQTTEAAGSTQGDTPALPADYSSEIKPPKAALSIFYLPKGRVTGLNMLGEALGWLMAWGTVGFFRTYVPAPVLQLFDSLFNPYGMAGITLLSALLIGQLLKSYQLKITALKRLATTAIEYGEVNHRADAQTQIDELLSTTEEKTEIASRWLVSWLTALGCLFIIGAFY